MVELFPLIQNPNIVYLVLLLGLWLVVTAAYSPGTGIMEALSALAVIVAFLAMSEMPTQWWAVALIVVGVSGFLALPFVSAKWELPAQAGLVLQVIGGLFLFEGEGVAPMASIGTVALAWVYHHYILLPALRRHRQAVNVTELDLLLGARGRVVKPLTPVGTVHVNGEMWTARSNEPLPSGMEVVVTDKVGLELRVEKAKNDTPEYHTNGVH